MFEVQKLRVNGTAGTATLFTTALFLYFALAMAITGLVRAAERYLSRGLEVGRGAGRSS